MYYILDIQVRSLLDADWLDNGEYSCTQSSALNKLFAHNMYRLKWKGSQNSPGHKTPRNYM